MVKAAEAFRTISEVAEWLDRPTHVLRFWESKFPQVKPVKRAGGRRYYRPQDMLLLGGIKKLLHDDGLTIKGVQKILREQGVSHVSALSDALEDGLEFDLDAVSSEGETIEEAQMAEDVVSSEGAQIVMFQPLAAEPLKEPEVIELSGEADRVEAEGVETQSEQAPTEPDEQIAVGPQAAAEADLPEVAEEQPEEAAPPSTEDDTETPLQGEGIEEDAVEVAAAHPEDHGHVEIQPTAETPQVEDETPTDADGFVARVTVVETVVEVAADDSEIEEEAASPPPPAEDQHDQVQSDMAKPLGADIAKVNLAAMAKPRPGLLTQIIHRDAPFLAGDIARLRPIVEQLREIAARD